MSRKTSDVAAAPVTLRLAFEAERTRRENERRERDEAERRQQEEDLGRAEKLQALLGADAEFLSARGLTLDRRRYTVTLDHADFRISTYFEAGRGVVRSADKRSAAGGALRKEQFVDNVEDAVLVMAQYLADEGV